MSLSSTEIPEDYALQPASPFLRLPAELRIQIYTYLLTCPVIRAFRRLHGRNHISSYVLPPLDLHPAMLAVCRQTYQEAAPILYGENVFAASPSLLTGLPFLLDASRPVLSSDAINRIRKWHLTIRLDVDARFDTEKASEAFSGAEELEIDAWQPQFGGVTCREVLGLFKDVRDVRRARVVGSLGSTDRHYANWLEGAMMTLFGEEVEPEPAEAPKSHMDMRINWGMWSAMGAG